MKKKSTIWIWSKPINNDAGNGRRGKSEILIEKKKHIQTKNENYVPENN